MSRDYYNKRTLWTDSNTVIIGACVGIGTIVGSIVNFGVGSIIGMISGAITGCVIIIFRDVCKSDKHSFATAEMDKL
jgi:outer membrane lipoprotein SlyB